VYYVSAWYINIKLRKAPVRKMLENLSTVLGEQSQGQTQP
jgi:hypothetical protein